MGPIGLGFEWEGFPLKTLFFIIEDGSLQNLFVLTIDVIFLGVGGH